MVIRLEPPIMKQVQYGVLIMHQMELVLSHVQKLLLQSETLNLGP